MKTNNLILIYDDYCPLCSWYSNLFVKTGLLSSKGRVPFSKADNEILSMINIDNARNQIPLIDRGNNKVYYGIDAILEVLNQKIPFIRSIGNISFVRWFLLKFYKFISYNRKVIVAKKCGNGSFDCAPDFNIQYRLMFMTTFLLFNTLMLWPIHKIVLSSFSFYHLDFTTLQLAHFAFVLTNISLAASFRSKKSLEYLGQVNMLALIAVLLLSPLIILNLIFPIAEWAMMFYLGMVTMFIIKEYVRRMEYVFMVRSNKTIVITNFACMLGFVAYLFH